MRGMIAAVVATGLAGMPAAASAQVANGASQGCAALAQAGVDAATAQIAAEDQTIQPPQSVRGLTCLDGFFNGTGLDVLVNFANFGNLVGAIQGQLCAAVTNAWRSTLGNAQCGLSVSGFDLGFGNLGGGSFCPRLNIGGNGSQLANFGVGTGGQTGFYLNGTQQLPSGYPQQ